MQFFPYRELGRTGFRASRLGIGDLADRQVPVETCVAIVRRALDAGLNLIDTAPNYEDGYSEQVVGRALQGRRNGVFLIDKIDHLHAPVEPQVSDSLARLQVEHLDLLVFHACSTMADLGQLQDPGGGFDQLAGEVRRGRTRFAGISSHNPEVLRAAITSGACDVVLFPLGPFVDRRYETEILPLAKSLNVGTVCFKTFGAGKLLGETEGYQRPLSVRPRSKLSSGGDAAAAVLLKRLSVTECVRYTLTLDPDVALLGLSFPNEQDAAFAAALQFSPLNEAQLAEVRRRAEIAIAGKGPVWWNPPAIG